jgi:hypothetical protein
MKRALSLVPLLVAGCVAGETPIREALCERCASCVAQVPTLLTTTCHAGATSSGFDRELCENVLAERSPLADVVRVGTLSKLNGAEAILAASCSSLPSLIPAQLVRLQDATFGEVCDDYQGCASPLACLRTSTKGFCTKKCSSASDCTESSTVCTSGFCHRTCAGGSSDAGTGGCPTGLVCNSGVCLPN